MIRTHTPIAVAATAICVMLSLACSGAGGSRPLRTAAPSPQASTGTDATSTPDAPVVVLDAGHGGDEVGAANHGVVEKDSNLDMALRVERLLRDAGVHIVLTRRDDRSVHAAPNGAMPGSFPSTRLDLQARVDIANAAASDVFVSFHSNGSTDAGQNGVEVWYDPNRSFGQRNRALAESVLANVLAELSAHGYRAVDRGIKDDTCFRIRGGRCFPLFLLGPERTITRTDLVLRGFDPRVLGFKEGEEAITSRATSMPGVLLELLFVSNAADAAMLRDEGARDAMARGIARALMEMLGLERGRLLAP